MADEQLRAVEKLNETIRELHKVYDRLRAAGETNKSETVLLHQTINHACDAATIDKIRESIEKHLQSV